VRPLEAEAMLRLARARIALGKKDKAAELLGRLVEQHRGTQSALQGKRLLDELQVK
jgi:TolA-binding protein